MVLPELEFLSNRERQIIDIIYLRVEATAREILEELPDPPGYSAIRSMLSRLVDKEILTVDATSRNHRYQLNVSRKAAQQGELQRLVKNFFGGSKTAAIVNLLGSGDEDLDEADLAEIMRLIKAQKTRSKKT